MKCYGLIGFPLGHSFSQRFFTEKFARERMFSSGLISMFIFDILNIPSGHN